MFFDSNFLMLVVPAFLFSMWAQWKVKSTYEKYQQTRNARGMSGVETAKYLLQANGIDDVQVEMVEGVLSDHYDPKAKKVRLSRTNYEGASLAALGVAAHEVGHAIQHQVGYTMLNLRASMLPVTSIGSTLAFPLIMIGFLFNAFSLVNIGILLFSAVVAFQLVTLPVEFDASKRALKQLGDYSLLSTQEVTGAKKVLNAAAMTYVAAAAVSIAYLLQFFLARRD